jgi:peptidylprolyl isomerase
MRGITAIALLLLASALSVNAQESAADKARERKIKIRTILEIQDRRTIHDGRLIEFLSDPDDIVRARAVMAYGSIQDTTVISLLVERFQHDGNPDVEGAASFAIGQTGSILSRTGRDALQHDIIWARMEQSSAMKQMIEDLGKFGSEAALKDLFLKFGESRDPTVLAALTMSIARFAIRNITYPASTQFIVKDVIAGTDFPWQKMYALQRIGAKVEVRSEIDKIAALYVHPDPLVRMNLAVLLSKIHDERSCLEPAIKLAEFDGDWRVRVAALRALGNFHLTGLPSALEVFRKAMSEQDPYIATTALTALGNADLNLSDSTKKVRSVRSLLEQICRNESGGYHWQVQAEAATAFAKLAGASALPALALRDSYHRLLRGQLLVATGITGAPEALGVLKPYLNDGEKILYRSALEGLQELSNRRPDAKEVVAATRDAAIGALEMNDVAIVTTAASILGDSLFSNPPAVAPLLRKLGNMRIPDDIEAMQEVIASLGKLKAKEAIDPLEKKLSIPERSIVLASAAALSAITGRSYEARIALKFEPLYTDFDWDYLESLPAVVHVKLETIRGDIFLDLYKEVAPFTVMSTLKLATRQGFYRGLTFHRVVPTFVVQGGDPRGDGWGGPGYAIRSEFSPLTYEPGTLGVASAGRDTEGSQFFITQTPQPHLDGRYTIFGKVTSGMDVVDKIQIDDRIFDLKVLP